MTETGTTIAKERAGELQRGARQLWLQTAENKGEVQMLGSRLAAQLWRTSVYTNKACRAVGAPVCFWCRGASAFICISAQRRLLLVPV